MSQEHLSVVCKHKHMLKSRAPLDNFGALYSLLFMEFYGLNNHIEF